MLLDLAGRVAVVIEDYRRFYDDPIAVSAGDKQLLLTAHSLFGPAGGIQSQLTPEQVAQAHRRLCPVDVLTACPGGPENIHLDIVGPDIDLNGIIFHQWIHKHGRKRGLAFALGVERADAHQAMHTVFTFHPAVGIGTYHFDAGRFDTGFLAGLFK